MLARQQLAAKRASIAPKMGADSLTGAELLAENEGYPTVLVSLLA